MKKYVIVKKEVINVECVECGMPHQVEAEIFFGCRNTYEEAQRAIEKSGEEEDLFEIIEC